MERSASGGLPGPESKVHPPTGGIGALARPRLEAAFTQASGSHRITVVNAPAGYGKTIALSGWARHSDLPCAWLSLDRFDTDPARLFRWTKISAMVRPRRTTV